MERATILLFPWIEINIIYSDFFPILCCEKRKMLLLKFYLNKIGAAKSTHKKYIHCRFVYLRINIALIFHSFNLFIFNYLNYMHFLIINSLFIKMNLIWYFSVLFYRLLPVIWRSAWKSKATLIVVGRCDMGVVDERNSDESRSQNESNKKQYNCKLLDRFLCFVTKWEFNLEHRRWNLKYGYLFRCDKNNTTKVPLTDVVF